MSKNNSNDFKISVIFLVGIVIAFFAGGIISEYTIPTMTTHVTGKVNLTINSTIAVSLAIDSVEFGVGNPPSGANFLVLKTETEEYSQYNFTTNVHPLVVENTGNTEANVTVISDKTALQFIGGDSPEFKFNVTENNTDTACAGTRAGTPEGDWTDMLTSAKVLCDVLNYTVDAGNTNDKLNIGIWINMSSSVPTGVKEATLTFEATESI